MFGTTAREALGFVLASMHQRSLRVAAVLAVAIVTALAGADRASAGVISACQTLSDFNTVYKLDTDLTSCGDCLVVANNKITIDLQGHSITSTCPGGGWGITDLGGIFDLITVKNGTVSGYEIGVDLNDSTRVSVLGVKATNNSIVGIWVGEGLVKSSETSGNDVGIEVDGDRGQVQQCNSHDNISVGIAALGDHCLITMNFANGNGQSGIVAGNKCTVSYNTANSNGVEGIDAGDAGGGTGHLVTKNTAINNADVDFAIACPSDVTNNTSSGGSYNFIGPGCHLVNNN
jgi:hypothetical protein